MTWADVTPVAVRNPFGFSREGDGGDFEREKLQAWACHERDRALHLMDGALLGYPVFVDAEDSDDESLAEWRSPILKLGHSWVADPA